MTIPEIPTNWKEKFVNDIPENPLEYYFCKVRFSEDTKRIYRIRQQRKAMPDSYGGIVIGSEVELWILTEQIILCDNHSEKPLTECIVRAFSNLDEAKFRAQFQVQAVKNIINAFHEKS